MKMTIGDKTSEISKRAVAAIVATAVSAAGFGGYQIVKAKADIIIEKPHMEGEAITGENDADAAKLEALPGVEPEPETKDTYTAEENIETEVIPKISVYVTGCVKKPGIVVLERGQLIDDALRAAGGTTEDADMEAVNLVYVLNENLMIYVKAKEKKAVSSAKTTVKKTSDPGFENAGTGVVITGGGAGAVLNEAKAAEKSQINLNTATAEQLETLPGIGPATAADILDYRITYGSFKVIADIMKVPGIKRGRFEKIKALITVG